MNKFCITLLIAFSACYSQLKIPADATFNQSIQISEKNDPYYDVYKIDSINQYYLIFARKRLDFYDSSKTSICEIVSEKAPDCRCRPIQNRGKYKLKLYSACRHPGDSKLQVASYLHIGGIGLPGNTLIAIEGDSIIDLFYAKNLKGLCITRHNIMD